MTFARLEAMANGKAFNALYLLIALEALAAIYLSRPWLTSDSTVYLALSESLANGQYGTSGPAGYVPDALRPPGYPLVIALLMKAIHLPVAAHVTVQVLLVLAVVYYVDRAVLIDPLQRLFFRLILIANPFIWFYAARLMTEAWTIVMMAWLYVQISSRQQSQWRSIAIGAVCGVAILFRSDLLLVPAAVAIVLAVRRQIRAAVLVAITTLAVLLPYASWNQQTFGQFQPTPVGAATGNSLYLATWQETLSPDDLNSTYSEPSKSAVSSGLVSEIAVANRSFGAPEQVSPFNPAGYPTQAQQRASSVAYWDLAVARIVADPATYARHVVRNGWALWNSSSYPASTPGLAVALLKAASVLAFLLGVAGGVVALVDRSKRWQYGSAVALIGAVLIVHLPLHTEARYTASVRLLLILLASLAASRIVRVLVEQRQRRARVT